MKLRMAVAFLLVLACAPVCFPQREKDKPAPTVDEENERERRQHEWLGPKGVVDSVPPALLSGLPRVKLPPEKGAWVVQVVTRGGFAGRGRGDVTLTSAGAVTCSEAVAAPCAEKLSPAALESLSKLIAGANPKEWDERKKVGACSDCYLTLLALKRRDEKGRAESYHVYWDDTTHALMPEEVKQIFSQAFELAAPTKAARKN